MRLLIAEPDSALAIFLSRGLEADGYRTRIVKDGPAAVSAVRMEQPDLIILDLGLSPDEGKTVLSEIRSIDRQPPILVMNAREDADDRRRWLEIGADETMLKPFSLLDMRARCRMLIWRAQQGKLTLRVADLELDQLDRSVRRAGQTITLTNKEFSLIEHLVLNRGRCVSRIELLETVWNLEAAQTTNIVDVYVNYLRRKLNDRPPGEIIRSVRGQGYFVPDDPASYRAVPNDTAKPDQAELIRAGDLELDLEERTVRRGDESITLTHREFALLAKLIVNRGRCVSREELLDSVWDSEPGQTTNIVDVYVNYLRRKLNDPPPGNLIVTVRGQGYLVPDEPELSATEGRSVQVTAPMEPTETRIKRLGIPEARQLELQKITEEAWARIDSYVDAPEKNRNEQEEKPPDAPTQN